MDIPDNINSVESTINMRGWLSVALHIHLRLNARERERSSVTNAQPLAPPEGLQLPARTLRCLNVSVLLNSERIQCLPALPTQISFG